MNTVSAEGSPEPSHTRRVAIVTGGARGLGRVMALALLDAGYAVTVTASSLSPELESLTREAVVRTGDEGRVLSLVADAADPATGPAVVDATLEAFGGLHAVVNNAGRGMRVVSESFTTDPVHFWEIPDAAWSGIIATNVNGPFSLAKAAMPHLLAQRDGRIVNVSTSAVTMTRRGYAPYGPSKAALEAMTRSWADDLRGSGVTANLLLPGGACATDLLPASATSGADGQLLDPAIMAAPAVWLCSADSGVLTGARVIAKDWDASLPDAIALSGARSEHVVGPAAD
ncbi:SDR family NAD(P)-dependent oxidoreductase [Marisediminicola sp. LYQ134]|uniref:SDR family NAD(P)-dependent oxidoreductase n=1 Tax=Marisediminicola sp. LYQ134 TaxID=3391061 RepID=UPI00398346C1